MPIEVISGPHYNAVGRGMAYGATPTAAVTLYGGLTALASWPVEALYDGIPASPMGSSAEYGTYYFDISLNMIPCGDGEQASAVGWSTTACSIATSATNVFKGAKSLSLWSSAGAGRGYLTIQVQAGDRLGYHVALGYVSAPDTAKLVVYDPQLGRWLAADGSWSAVFTAAFESSETAAFESKKATFTVPSVSEWLTPAGELEVSIYPSDSGGGGNCFAELVLYPMVDFLGLFGHNLPAAAAVSLTSYADWWHGGAATVEASWSSPQRPVAWLPIGTPLAHPFYRLTIAASPFQLWCGELVLGRRSTLSAYSEYSPRLEIVHPQVRNVSRGGSGWAQAAARYPIRSLSLPFDVDSAAAAEMQDLGAMTRGGQTPIVLLPGDTHPDVCMLGRIQERQSFAMPNFLRQTTELFVVEEAFPSLD